MEDVFLSREEAFTAHRLYERKDSVEDLCLLLSNNKSIVEEGNLFYKQLLLDKIECIENLKSFWDKTTDFYEIELKEDEEISFDYITRKVIIKKKSELQK